MSGMLRKAATCPFCAGELGACYCRPELCAMAPYAPDGQPPAQEQSRRGDRDPNRGNRRIPLSWASAADQLGLNDDEPPAQEQERDDAAHSIGLDGLCKTCDAPVSEADDAGEVEPEWERLRVWLLANGHQEWSELVVALATAPPAVDERIAAAKADGWDEGHAVGWQHCQDGNYGTDYWDDETPNPHRRAAGGTQ